MTSSRGTNSPRIDCACRRIDRANRAEQDFEHKQVPERKSAEIIDREKNCHRDGGGKIYQDQQKLAIIAIDEDTAEGTKNQTGQRAAQPQDSQRHRRAGDFIGDPEKCHFLDEVADGTEHVRGPEYCVVAVA
jgi:hypothetical protein